MWCLPPRTSSPAPQTAEAAEVPSGWTVSNQCLDLQVDVFTRRVRRQWSARQGLWYRQNSATGLTVIAVTDQNRSSPSIYNDVRITLAGVYPHETRRRETAVVDFVLPSDGCSLYIRVRKQRTSSGGRRFRGASTCTGGRGQCRAAGHPGSDPGHRQR